MKRPLHNLLATCRSVRQAVALWKWVSAACASAAAFLTRLRASISGFATGRWFPSAAAVERPERARSDGGPKPAARRLWRRLKLTALRFGFPRSKPADPTSPTAQKSSNASSNTSAERAASRPCSSSSTTTRGPGARPARDCSRPSFGSCRRTSIRAGLSDRSHSGRRTSLSRSCRFASSRP